MKNQKKYISVRILQTILFLIGIFSFFYSCSKTPTEPEISKTGNIQVYSVPTGAKVFIDGTDTGRITNCILPDLKPGNHILKLIKEGYVDTELNVTVTAGVTTPVYINLAAHAITILEPKSGSIWIKGEEVEIKWQTDNLISLRGNASIGDSMTKFVNTEDYLSRGISSRESSRLHYVREGTSSLGEEVQNSRKSSIKESKSENVDRPRLNLSSDLSTISPIQSYEKNKILGNIKPLTLTNIKIELFKGANQIRMIVSSTENDGTYKWTVPNNLEEGSDYKVKISCVEDANVYVESDSFRIEKKSFTILKPNADTVWTIGDTEAIEWRNTGTINNVKIELFRGTYQAWSHVKTIVSSTQNDGLYSWKVDQSLEPDDNYIVGIFSVGESDIQRLSEIFTIQGGLITKRYYSEDTPIVIWEATSDSSKITIEDSGIIRNVKYRLDIREYWTDDLNVTLKHNNVQEYIRNDDTPTIYIRTTDKFNGMRMNGDWIIYVRLSDLAFPSNYLDSWWIEITFNQTN